MGGLSGAAASVGGAGVALNLDEVMSASDAQSLQQAIAMMGPQELSRLGEEVRELPACLPHSSALTIFPFPPFNLSFSSLSSLLAGTAHPGQLSLVAAAQALHEPARRRQGRAAGVARSQVWPCPCPCLFSAWSGSGSRSRSRAGRRGRNALLCCSLGKGHPAAPRGTPPRGWAQRRAGAARGRGGRDPANGCSAPSRAQADLDPSSPPGGPRHPASFQGEICGFAGARWQRCGGFAGFGLNDGPRGQGGSVIASSSYVKLKLKEAEIRLFFV